MSDFALVEHRLQLALVLAADAAPEEMGCSIGTTHQQAQLAGTSEHGLQWRRTLEDHVGRQFHLSHAVPIARPQGVTLGWTEDWDHAAHPVVAATLQDRRTQPIGGYLHGVCIANRQEGVVGLAEADAVAS